MSNWLVVAVTVAYAWTGLEQGLKGQVGFCIMFVGYALANIGLIYSMNAGGS